MASKMFTLVGTLVFVAILVMAQAVVGAAPGEGKARKVKLVHVVSFKFKESATPAQITELVDAFRALPGKIRQISSFEWGTNVSPEKHDKGFTHCFVLTFKTEKARDEYLVHPDHKVFGSMAGKVLADVFVVDYWASK